MLLLLFVQAALADNQAGRIPDFDTAGYCRAVGDAVCGSYVIEESCRKEEEKARSSIQRQRIPERTFKYCTEVGQAVGGSFAIMKACVDQELKAAARLQFSV